MHVGVDISSLFHYIFFVTVAAIQIPYFAVWMCVLDISALLSHDICMCEYVFLRIAVIYIYFCSIFKGGVYVYFLCFFFVWKFADEFCHTTIYHQHHHHYHHHRCRRRRPIQPRVLRTHIWIWYFTNLHAHDLNKNTKHEKRPKQIATATKASSCTAGINNNKKLVIRILFAV